MLEFYTVSLKRAGLRDPDLFDVTRGTGGPAGAPFAPSWAILNPALAGMRQGGANARKAWEEYVPAYRAEMGRSFIANQSAWKRLLARKRVVLGCHCRDRERCHRGLLAAMLVELGAVDRGELP